MDDFGAKLLSLEIAIHSIKDELEIVNERLNNLEDDWIGFAEDEDFDLIDDNDAECERGIEDFENEGADYENDPER